MLYSRVCNVVMDEIVEALLLDECTKDQLVKIAGHYNIDLGNERVKNTVRANLKFKLLKINVFSVGEAMSVSAGTEGTPPSLVAGPGAMLSFEQHKELLMLRTKLENERSRRRESATKY